MTGNDHTDALRGDAITGALRSSALPFELAGEDAAVAVMVDALTTAPEPSSLRRPRRVAAFAAVTVASLGVGGLVAAGPGRLADILQNNDPAPNSVVLDQPSTTTEPGDDEAPSTTSIDDSDTEDGDIDGDIDDLGTDDLDTDDDDTDDDETDDDETDDDETDDGVSGGVDRVTTDPDVECADGNHGKTVSSVAHAGGDTTSAAQSDCGKPVTSTGNEGGNGNDDPSPNTAVDTDTDTDTDNGNGNGNGNSGGNGNGNAGGNGPGVPGPPASTPGNDNPGPPASNPGKGNGNG